MSQSGIYHGMLGNPMYHMHMGAPSMYMPQSGMANGQAAGYKLFVGMIPYSTGTRTPTLMA